MLRYQLVDALAHGLPFNLELKRSSRGEYPGMEAAAVAEVTRRGLLDQMLFSSFYPPVLEALREVSPEVRVAVLISPRSPQGAIERARELGAEALNP